jgi:hypothetical protein
MKVLQTLFVFIFLLCGVFGLIAFMYYMMPSVSSTNIYIADPIKNVIVPVLSNIGAILIVVFTALTTVLVVIVIVNKPVIKFLDSRMLPRPKNLELLTEKELTQGEYYETNLNEQFEFVKIPAWWATTFKEMLSPMLVQTGITLIISIIIYIALGQMFFIYKMTFCYVINVFFFLTLMIKYIVVEWHRQNNLTILFTHTMVALKAHGSVQGILTGRASDVSRSTTPLNQIREPKTETDPRRFKNAEMPNDLTNEFYDFLGGIEGIRSVFIPSIAENAQDYLNFLTHANSFGRILLRLKDISFNHQEEIDSIGKMAENILVGVPNGEYDYDEQLRKKNEFIASRTNRMIPKKVINLFALKNLPGRWNLTTGELLEVKTS